MTSKTISITIHYLNTLCLIQFTQMYVEWKTLVRIVCSIYTNYWLLLHYCNIPYEAAILNKWSCYTLQKVTWAKVTFQFSLFEAFPCVKMSAWTVRCILRTYCIYRPRVSDRELCSMHINIIQWIPNFCDLQTIINVSWESTSLISLIFLNYNTGKYAGEKTNGQWSTRCHNYKRQAIYVWCL